MLMTEYIVVHMVTIVMPSAIAMLMMPLKKLKLGKSDGYDGLTLDCINNGTSLLTHYLSLLFSLKLSHCYTPTSCCVSTMVPIPKRAAVP